MLERNVVVSARNVHDVRLPDELGDVRLVANRVARTVENSDGNAGRKYPGPIELDDQVAKRKVVRLPGVLAGITADSRRPTGRHERHRLATHVSVHTVQTTGTFGPLRVGGKQAPHGSAFLGNTACCALVWVDRRPPQINVLSEITVSIGPRHRYGTRHRMRCEHDPLVVDLEYIEGCIEGSYMIVDTELRAGFVKRMAKPEKVDDHNPISPAQPIVERTEVVAGCAESVQQHDDAFVKATRWAAVEYGKGSGAATLKRGRSPATNKGR